MQDTSTSQLQFKQVNNQAIFEKQRFFQQLLQPNNARNPFISYDSFSLPSVARKLLETVLVNCNINAVPSSRDEYSRVTSQILESESKSTLNIAHVLRSMVDLVKYDSKLYSIIFKFFGFQYDSRNFHNALFKNLNELGNDDYIGEVYLKDFMIYFGLIYELFHQKDEKIMKARLTSYQNFESNHDATHSYKANQQFSLISPTSSQQIQEAKQLEANSIVQVFESTLLQCQNRQTDLSEQSRNHKWSNKIESSPSLNCEDLMAHEQLQIEEHQFNNSNQHFMQNGGYSFLNPPIIQNQRVQYQPQTNNYIQNMLLNMQQQQQHQQNNHQKQQNAHNKSLFSLKLSTFSSKDIGQDKIRYFQDSYKNYHESLISSENSKLNTPLINYKPQIDNLYPNNSEIKARPSTRSLFNQNDKNNNQNNHNLNIPQLPILSLTPIQNLQAPQKEHGVNPKTLFQSANKNSSSSPKSFKNIVGQKRSTQGTDKLEKQVVLNDDAYKTPNKRTRLDFQRSVIKSELDNAKFEESDEKMSESEEEKENGEINDNASSASRKKRGLKILSVKVQELVYKRQQTTYKDVANELIEQLRDNKKKMQELMGNEGDESIDADCDEDDLSDDSPQKKGDNKDSSQQVKWEKNVRRRVYDALNVLYAAGVLKKEGKNVSCDNKVFQLTNKMKDHHPHNRSMSQRNISSQDQRMLQQIELLKQQLSAQRQRVEEKREILSDQFKHFISYKHLIDRNEINKNRGIFDPKQQISLPFILVTTNDSPENEVEISFGDQNRQLKIAMKKPMKCIGDADTLMKLGFYQVSQDWFDTNMSDFTNVLKSLSEKQRLEIII